MIAMILNVGQPDLFFNQLDPRGDAGSRPAEEFGETETRQAAFI